MKVLQRSYCFLISTTSIVVNNIKRCNAALPPDIGYCEDAGGTIRDDVSIIFYSLQIRGRGVSCIDVRCIISFVANFISFSVYL